MKKQEKTNKKTREDGLFTPGGKGGPGRSKKKRITLDVDENMTLLEIGEQVARKVMLTGDLLEQIKGLKASIDLEKLRGPTRPTSTISPDLVELLGIGMESLTDSNILDIDEGYPCDRDKEPLIKILEHLSNHHAEHCAVCARILQERAPWAFQV